MSATESDITALLGDLNGARAPQLFALAPIALLVLSAVQALGAPAPRLATSQSAQLVASPALHSSLRDSIRFERLEGIAHNTVFSILQDREGFLWIGTAGGLNRYDGSEMRTYRHVWNDSTSISDNTVRSLAEDREGRLWIGTASGLNRFDRLSNHFDYISLRSDGREVDVAALLPDANDGLWAHTYGDSLFLLDTRAARVTHRWPSDESGKADPGTLIPRLVDRHERTWIAGHASGGGTAMYVFRPADALLRKASLNDPLPQGLTLHPGRTHPWAVHGAAVSRVDPEAARLEAVLRLPEDVSGHHRLLEARDGTLWIGTSTGIYRADPATKMVEHHRLEAAGTESLSNYVLALYQDRAGAIWVGTRSGLFRYDPHEKPFVNLRPGAGLPRGENTGTVMAIETDARGNLWIGTMGGGLLHADRSTGRFTRYRHRPRDASSLPDDRIWALLRDADGRLLVGTESGLCVLDPVTGQFTKYALPAPSFDATIDGLGAVYAIVSDGRNGYWIGRPWDLFLLDARSGDVKKHVVLGRRIGYPALQTIRLGMDGTLWIGTEGAGLVRYDAKRDFLTRVSGESGPATPRTGWAPERVWTMHPDDRGNLWLGTDLGLVRFDVDATSFQHFGELEQQSAAIVYSILEDGKRRLWLGTSHGLARFDPVTRSFRRYDALDGIGNVEFNRRAATRMADGTFLFGGLEGLTVFHPGAVRDNPYVPPVVVTAIRKTSPDGTEAVVPALARRDGLTLSHRDHVFSFTYSALNFTDSEKNRYAYLLEGYDNGWVDAGTRREARYTNVPPGTYLFRVKGSNNDGIWNAQGASMRVTITPPFYATWWFRLLSLAAALGVVTGAYRYRIAQIRRVERLRLRIAADLHDDVGSQLSSIALMSEIVRDRAALTADERDELTRIGSAARRLVDGLREIVWFIDPNHDGEEALLRKMESTARDLLHGVTYTFETPRLRPQPFADVQLKRDVFLIYKETLHNVARHARAGYVRIAVRWDRDAFEFVVTDNGVGFDPDRRSEGHGLRNMRLRAEKIGARLEIESRPGAGTTSRLHLDLA